jgi:putative ABC transport system substrate-binding protein
MRRDTVSSVGKLQMFGVAVYLAIWCFASNAAAQQIGKNARIGYLDAGTRAGNAALLDILREELRRAGWIEGKNLSLEYRFGENKGPNRLVELSAELIRLDLDVIVVSGTAATLAAKKATSSIPIVMSAVGDPVGQGIIASLARPGGNITGLAGLTAELGGKRLELLKEVVPTSTVVALFVIATDGRAVGGGELQAKAIKATGPALGLKVEVFGVTEDSFQTAVRERFHGFITTSGQGIFGERKRIVALARKYRLPGIYPQKEFVTEGGLASYGVDRPDQLRRTAIYIDRILKGGKPSEMPVEQPTKFEFVINLKTAKQIGLVIPPNVLARADKVIR